MTVVYGPGEVAVAFRDFAARARDPRMRDLALAAAEAPEVLALCARVTDGQPVPMLLIAAVRYVRMRDLGLDGAAGEWPMTPAAFVAFCGGRAEDIRAQVTTRRLQTNHVGRCAALLPAFGLVARAVGDRPLAMLEVGTSAGLNLMWDRFRYDYGGATAWGDAGAAVSLRCALEGPCVPPMPPPLPVACRVGIDLAPLAVTRDDDLFWLLACYVGGRPETIARARAVAGLVRQARPDLIPGDAVQVLPRLLADLPRDMVACVYHSVTTYQFSRDQLRAFDEVLGEASLRRPVYHVAFEAPRLVRAPMYELRLSGWEGGARDETVLGFGHREGEWLAWKPAAGDAPEVAARFARWLDAHVAPVRP